MSEALSYAKLAKQEAEVAASTAASLRNRLEALEARTASTADAKPTALLIRGDKVLVPWTNQRIAVAVAQLDPTLASVWVATNPTPTPLAIDVPLKKAQQLLDALAVARLANRGLFDLRDYL